MKIVHCAQGSSDWFSARAGVITASMFSVARERVGVLDDRQRRYVDLVRSGKDEAEAAKGAGYKSRPSSDSIRRAIAGERVGDFSEAAKNYAFRVAIERIGGEPLDEGFETWAMRRGHEMEPQARREHEVQTGAVVQRAGFVLTDDEVFGASADGIIGDDGGSEYKCLVSPERLRSIYLDGDISEFADQVQGCMWITGRKWWHFGLYCPALEPVGMQFWWREIKRDDDYIERMELDLVEFSGLVDQYEARIRAMEKSE